MHCSISTATTTVAEPPQSINKQINQTITSFTTNNNNMKAVAESPVHASCSRLPSIITSSAHHHFLLFPYLLFTLPVMTCRVPCALNKHYRPSNVLALSPATAAAGGCLN
mmetsp:Transcript_85496/g.170694  ORF Transcript_85496/g.170694 Transcript_85496/m.170694 type:complete len:110 (-) Transcript_85496:704-1033(-)